MKKTRLKSVLNLAETRENTAAMDFIKARKNCAANQVQLEQLRTFRSDYQTETSVSQSARDFQSTRVFLSQLSDVIDQQEKQVAEALDEMNIKQDDWTKYRVKRRSVEMLIEKKAKTMDRERDRRDQKELDEIANRLHR